MTAQPCSVAHQWFGTPPLHPRPPQREDEAPWCVHRPPADLCSFSGMTHDTGGGVGGAGHTFNPGRSLEGSEQMWALAFVFLFSQKKR